MPMPYRPPAKILHSLLINAPSIIGVVNEATNYAFRKAYFDLSGRAGEVEYLLYFFLEAIPAIGELLNSILNPHDCRVSVGGIFCHQTPKVRSMKPQLQTHSCELGDILFLVAYDRPNSGNSVGLGNASLVGAKFEHQRPKGPQSILYESAEEFSYTSPASLYPHKRSLRTARNCLWYWSFQDVPRHHNTSFELARPSGIWEWEESLGRFLFDLFSGVSGRGVRQRPRGNGWSQIVHDLLQDTAHRLVTRKTVITNGARFSSAGSALAALSSRQALRFLIGDIGALYSSIGYPMEFEQSGLEDLETAHNFLPPNDRRPLDRGEEGQGDGITTVILRFSHARE